MSWDVHCSMGKMTLEKGAFFRLFDGSRWELVKPAGGRIYSPSGFGGTPTFWCLPIGDVPSHYERYVRNGMVAFCGDSIASVIMRSTLPTPNG